MKWLEINSKDFVNQLLENSCSSHQLIFKHSTRCSISSMALRRAEDNLPIGNLSANYLDLIAYRDVSNYIAELTGVTHQSPQVILIRNKEVIYHASHGSIDWKEIGNLCVN
ncbi:MAG: bacillithiol system redox-active protein YtxJ [Flavobacteriales bacterium]|nr:bacillithiol system redox-active protein YtxJ [Flavobacteriales bacterium]